MFLARYKKFIIPIAAVLVLVVRYWYALPVFDNNYVGSYMGREMVFVGIVRELPEDELKGGYAKIEVTGFKKFSAVFPLHGRVSVAAWDFSGFSYGDAVEFFGQLQPLMAGDPRIAGQIRADGMKLMGKGGGAGVFFMNGILKFKHFVINRLNNLLPEPASSITAGILMGSRSSIPKNIIDDFRAAGLTHILAISGYNIVILISFITTVFSVFPKKIGFFCSVAAIALFTLLTGASASVTRASVMGSMTLFAKMFGRKSSGMRPLVIAAYAMALADPFVPVYDIGFQLSFGATAGIILFTKRLEVFLKRIPEKLSLRSTMATTWAAQALTTPLIIYYFSNFSIIATISNLVVLPFIPLAMLGGALTLLFGKILAAPTWLFFEILLKVIHFFASLPFASIDFGTS